MAVLLLPVRIATEGLVSAGGIVAAGGVAEKCVKSAGGIVVAGGVAEERRSPLAVLLSRWCCCKGHRIRWRY